MPATKKTAAKIVKKSTIKKPIKKAPIKKTAIPEDVTKKVTPKKPSIKKVATKKPAAKKVVKRKTKKKVEEVVIKRAANLAKTILSKSGEKRAEPTDIVPERKNDALQKIIIAKKTEGRNKVTFKVGDYAIYPSHGIGQIVDIENTRVLGQDFSCYLMNFEKEKLIIKIPTDSAEKIGLRHLINKTQMDEVFSILRSGVKKLKGMWSRRAQEYETKINSGDIILLAEVLRDLTRDIEDGERSYSERIIYETAIYRLAGEYSVIYDADFEESKEKIILTAKDKLNSEGKITQKDDFDDFDDEESSLNKNNDDEDDDEDEDDSEEEEDEDDDDYDD